MGGGEGRMSKTSQFTFVRRLKLLYEDVNDIDLFVGGVLEEPHRYTFFKQY